MTKPPTEQILDSFLEELLAGKHPPDLTERIKSAWIAEKLRSSAAERVVAELVDEPIKPVVRRQRSPAVPVMAHRLQRERRAEKMVFFQALLAVVAASILALFGWSIMNEQFMTPEQVANSQPAAPITGMPGDAPLDAGPQPTGQPREVPSVAGDPADNRRPAVDPQAAPARPRNTASVLDASRSFPLTIEEPDPRLRPSPPSLPLPLADPQVVEQLNAQLAELWRDTGVSPGPAIDPARLGQRLAQRLTGETAALSNRRFTREELVQQAVDSPRFARHFAGRLVRSWLGGSSVDVQSSEVLQLIAHIARRVEGNSTWNEVVLDLLGGQLSGEAPATTFVQALAGSGNHRLVQRLGTHFLNESLACVRCHDDFSSLSRERPGIATQENYWSMVAMLKGIEASGNAARGQRTLVDQQKELFEDGNPTVFFELPDHRMKAAAAVLPDGRHWNALPKVDVPRQALAEWIAASEQMDAATVNHVWQLLIGRPLVPHVEAVESVGMAARQQLLAQLSGQFRAHGRNMRQLVGWVAASDAFHRRPGELTKEQWLNADQTDLQQLLLAELVFAVAPTIEADIARSLEDSLATVVNLRNVGGFASADSTLAQPNLAQPKNKNGTPPQNERSGRANQDSVEFLIQGELHTAAQQQYVQRLVTSRELNWAERVEHVVALHPSYGTTNRIQQQANELLQHHAGDAAATLLDLIRAVEATD